MPVGIDDVLAMINSQNFMQNNEDEQQKWRDMLALKISCDEEGDFIESFSEDSDYFPNEEEASGISVRVSPG